MTIKQREAFGHGFTNSWPSYEQRHLTLAENAIGIQMRCLTRENKLQLPLSSATSDGNFNFIFHFHLHAYYKCNMVILVVKRGLRMGNDGKWEQKYYISR